MKQAVLLIMMLLAAANADAQKIYFSDTGNIWQGYNWTIMPDRYYPITGGYLHDSNGFAMDTIINGLAYHRLEYAGMELGIREDKAAGKIYCRFLSANTFVGARYIPDASEHLFFDYNLQVGDPFVVQWGAYYSRHRVASMSSIMIGGAIYRSWHMAPDTARIFPGNQNYTFIEGVGTDVTPISSICNYWFEGNYKLTCFKTNNWQPVLSPKVGSFDNYVSCNWVAPSSVQNNVTAMRPTIIPNPGSTEIILQIPAPLTNAELIINDAIGRMVVRIPAGGKTAIPVGQYLSVPGNYYYTLRDAASGQPHTGQFSFR